MAIDNAQCDNSLGIMPAIQTRKLIRRPQNTYRASNGASKLADNLERAKTRRALL